MSNEEKETLLSIENLSTFFYTRRGIVQAVNGLGLEIKKGETPGLVGESGCGKSVTALSIMRLIQRSPREKSSTAGSFSTTGIWSC